MPAQVSLSALLFDEDERHRGWQLFATERDGSTDVATYSEADTVQAALARCLEFFPREQGYNQHGVKDIETQEHTMLKL
jgi:hypothetical protein